MFEADVMQRDAQLLLSRAQGGDSIELLAIAAVVIVAFVILIKTMMVARTAKTREVVRVRKQRDAVTSDDIRALRKARQSGAVG
ncbi:MAG: hypothetical protein ACPGID_09735 [Rubricella sp.]